MPFRFDYNGCKIEVDAAQEAADLIVALRERFCEKCLETIPRSRKDKICFRCRAKETRNWVRRMPVGDHSIV